MGRMGRINNLNLGVAVFFLVALSIFIWPLLESMHLWPAIGGHDSDEMITRLHLERETLLRFRQFPFWTPHLRGGSQLFFILSMILSPLYLLILLFGEIIGLKLWIIIQLFLGIFGMYLLSRKIGCSKISACFPPTIFLFGSIYPLQVAEGTYYSITLAWIPWIFLCYLKSLTKIKYILPSIFFCILVLFGGGLHPVLFFTLMFIFIYALAESQRRKDVLALKSFSLLFIFVLLIGAVHFIPWVELIQKYGVVFRYTNYPRHNDLGVFMSALFSPNQLLNIPRHILWGLPSNVGFWEQRGAYIGVGGLFLYLFGIRKALFGHSSLLITNISFLLLSTLNIIIPNTLMVSFYKICPALSSYNYPRFIWMFAFSLSLIAGLGAKNLEEKVSLQKKKTPFLIMALLVLIMIDFILVNGPIFKEAFTTHSGLTSGQNVFKQIMVKSDPEKNTMYNAVMKNCGACSEIHKGIVLCNVISYGSKRYRGEIYLKNHGANNLEITLFTPNIIKVKVFPRADDLLVLNQNYDPNWKIWGESGKNTICLDGLLGAKVSSGNPQILTFYYLPKAFFIGLIITLLTFFSIILYFTCSIKERFFKFSILCLLILFLTAIIYVSKIPLRENRTYYNAINFAAEGFKFSRENMFSKARPFLEEASKYFPNSIALHEKLRETYRQLGLAEEAASENNAIEELLPPDNVLME